MLSASNRDPDTSGDDWFSVLRAADRARAHLVATRSSDRSRALQAMAHALQAAQDDILEANTIDLEGCREKPLPPPLMAWLKLSPDRLKQVVTILERLSDLPDPIRQAVYASHPVYHSQTYCQLMPLGTIAFVYETLPELAAIAAGMCLKTANCSVLYGSREAKYTNAALALALAEGLRHSDLPPDCLAVLPSDRDISIRDLVTQDRYLNLIIPYGRPKLVQQVNQATTVPVLQAAMGNCYLYWSLSGDLDVVRWAVSDSHQTTPDPVNAIEKVLIHSNHNRSTLAILLGALHNQGFEIRLDEALAQEFPELPEFAIVAADEWDRPYLTKTIAFKTVDSLSAAITWICLLYTSDAADE